ncbi:DUF5723 family protein [Roseivirga misakiensis]|uniref:DUF5723 domain-containing protein n=1 Tax=Roseivirga misakiensis TaxID=1563681 RepID=A0A1E5T703_9BACT|nr:DUF5723 family protein [Roseivirga misakiensis]OEK07149.1 hypothetical protein BFP71_05690 [Roseivirga misakiensis]
MLSSRVQPAAIADSPYKFDFNLVNGNYYLTNNIGFTQRGAEGTELIRFLDRDPRFLQTNLGLGGMSVLFSLPRKQGLAIQFQLRAAGSTQDLTADFITQINRFSDQRFIDSNVTNQTGEFAFAAWQELALTYAFVQKDDGFHRWKVGGTLKFVNPMGSVWLDMQDIDYSVDNVGIVNFTEFRSRFGYSANLDRYQQFDGTDAFNGLPKGTGFRPAVDFGVVYERVAYRRDPRAANRTALERDITYEFKLAASITDLGIMNFDQGSAAFATLGVNPGVPTPGDILDNINSFQELRDSLDTFLQIEGIDGTYSVSLPTSLNLSYDYNVGNNLYFGASARIDLTGLLPADFRVAYPNSITLNPRYETGNYGFYMPIFYNFSGDTDLGMALRYGAFTVGTPSFGSFVSKQKKSGGVYFSVSINKLKANSKKPYCFGRSTTGSGFTRTQRTPLYKRKRFLFF